MSENKNLEIADKAPKKVVENTIEVKVEERIGKIFQLQTEQSLVLRSSTVAERKLVLQKFLSVIEKYTSEIVEAGQKDFNKPETETLIAEVFPVVHEIKHALKHLSSWAKPKKVSSTKATFGTKSKVVYEPKGVSLIISPWNYPVNLTFGPLVSALAAGCTAIIKPSEFTPHMSKVISKIVDEAFDEKLVAVFEGEVDVSLALLECPFDHIFFTGSPQVGKSIMVAAAKHLSSVTLELGGKSPVVVDETTDLEKTAGKIAWGKFANNGQTCIAPDYVIVHESKVDELVTTLKQTISNAYGASPKTNDDYGRIVNRAHTNRIKDLIDDGIKNEGLVVVGGEIDVKDRYISPTVVVGKYGDKKFLNSKLMTEEIFGPVLPIISYREIGEVINQINSMPKPLALYMYSENKSLTDYVLQRTSSGGACINTNMVQFLHGNLPFGGVNNSGIGNAHGEFGFKAFSHERAVLEDKFTSNHMLYPPYTKRVKSFVKFVNKYLA